MRETKLGGLRKLGSPLYTRNLTEQPELIVRRNLWLLVAAYLPGTLIADRTALENRRAADGSVFLTAHRKRDIVLAGLTLRSRKGLTPLETDQPSQARDGVARTFSKREIEERLDEMLRHSGEDLAGSAPVTRLARPKEGASGERAGRFQGQSRPCRFHLVCCA